MKPISDFVKQMTEAEKALKQAILEGFKTIDEAKAKFIDTYNAAQTEMAAEVAQREQSLRATVAKAVEALNGDTELGGSESESKLAPAPTIRSVEQDPTGLSA
jgi:Mg-chelatase subunit ChlI